MHITPLTGDRCFKETGAGVLTVLMCHCATNAFYITIIFVSRDSLEMKEIICAIIRNFIYYFDWFWAHLLQTLVYMEVHNATHTPRTHQPTSWR